MRLSDLGWTPRFAVHHQSLFPDLLPGRVSAEFREAYRLLCADGERRAHIDGHLRHNTVSRSDFPAVGDWVVYSPVGTEAATIHGVLPRRNRVARQAAGRAADAQIIGANIDTLFLVSALNSEFNVRRIERYVALTRESQAQPVIVLNKADLCSDVEQRLEALAPLSLGMPIHIVSAVRGEGVDALRPYLHVGQTVAIVGSSGVGKSTLINALAGEQLQATGEVRLSDGRGKHTTTHRSLVQLPAGALLLDTPGMRELALWSATDGLHEAFADIEALRRQCRFSDCTHESEPGCAVRGALRGGSLDEARLRNYKKLERELEFQERKTDARARVQHKLYWKAIHKEARQRDRFKG